MSQIMHAIVDFPDQIHASDEVNENDKCDELRGHGLMWLWKIVAAVVFQSMQFAIKKNSGKEVRGQNG